MHTRSKSGGGNGIGRHDRTIDPHQIQVIFKGVKIDVHPIGNEAKPKVFTQGKETLQNVMVAGKLNRTTIAKVGNHAQSALDRLL